MRKVLSFVLVLSLVLGSFGMAFAAPLSDVAGEKSEEAVKVLTELGVVSGYPDGTYKPGNIVTRAEMAVIVVRALGLADYATGTSSFSDMGGHWSNPYVAYATSLGIISGYPDGTFRPDKTVSYDEAATMLVAALGYNADSLIGTWPANFVTKAKTLGILDGIKAGAAGANRGDIAIMTYQTLDQAIGKTNKDGDFVYDKDGDGNAVDTMLSRLGAALYTPDVVGAEAGEAFVVTGDEKTIINLKPFLGAYVTAYANSDDEIIAIKEIKSVYLTGEFDGTTFEADKDYTVDATEHAQFTSFVNGEVDTDIADLGDVIDGDEYTLAAKVSGKKITEVYSIAKWVAEPSFLFEEDMADEIADDLAINGFAFVEDDNEEIDLKEFELLGVAALEDLEEDNVVTVYLKEVGDADSGIARIEVGTEIVEGEVTKITSAITPKVTVNGKAYSKADDYEALFDGFDWNEIDVEDEVALYLNYAGKVFTAEQIEGSTADNYAIVLKTELAGTGAITGKDALIELFLADGSVKVFDVKTDVDAYTVGSPDSWNVASGDMVKYGVDDKGVIDALEAVSFDKEGADSKVTDKGYFDGKSVASDVLIFTYDGNEGAGHADWADDEFYGITTLAKIKGNEYDDVDYILESNKITVMYIFGEGDSSDEVYGLVTDYYKTSASDSGYMATVLVDGAEVEYEVTENLYNGTGGITKIAASQALQLLKFNSKGQISDLTEVTSSASYDAVRLADGILDGAYSSNNLTIDRGADWTVDSAAIAYKWDTDDDVYVKSSVSRTNLKDGVYVILYDLDDDKVVDVILIGLIHDEDLLGALAAYNDILNEVDALVEADYTPESWALYEAAIDLCDLTLDVTATKAALEAETDKIQAALDLLELDD